MKNRISNSALDLYLQCPRKYKFKYIENLKGDYTSTPLLFGSAIDAALNYILESIRDKKEWTKLTAGEIFSSYMDKWDRNQRLEFFKNEVPDYLQESIDTDNPDHWQEVHANLVTRGLNCLEVYINDVLPQIDTVVSVQDKFEVENEEGDIFTGVVDFIAKLKDGRTVLLDNKTASAKYPKNKVVKSQQLSFYIEQFPEIKYAGYIVLIKNPAREKGLTYQIMVDEIPESTRAEAFERLDKAMRDIKAEIFPCNFKGCNAYGKECEFLRACQYGDYTGLIPNKNEKN